MKSSLVLIVGLNWLFVLATDLEGHDWIHGSDVLNDGPIAFNQFADAHFALRGFGQHLGHFGSLGRRSWAVRFLLALHSFAHRVLLSHLVWCVLSEVSHFRHPVQVRAILSLLHVIWWKIWAIAIAMWEAVIWNKASQRVNRSHVWRYCDCCWGFHRIWV